MKGAAVMILASLTFIACASSTPETPSDQVSTMALSLSVSANQPTVLDIVQFHAEVAGGQPPYQYEWDLDAADGVAIDKIQPDPTAVYEVSGRHIATLVVRDSLGSTTTETLPVDVAPRAFTKSVPIKIRNVHGTAEHPYIIEGLEISGYAENGIEVEDSSYVVIRHNLISGVSGSLDTPSFRSNAIWITNSSNITVSSNLVKENWRGIAISATPGEPQLEEIRIEGNVVIGQSVDASILVRGADGVEVIGNRIVDNGDIRYFAEHRIGGIAIWDSNNIVVRDNLAEGSSSDGIGIAVSREVLEVERDRRSRSVTVIGNTVRDNGEQGIWLSQVQGGEIASNFSIGNITRIPGLGSSGINLEGRTHGLLIHDNQIAGNDAAGITISGSGGNRIYSNLFTGNRDPAIVIRSETPPGDNGGWSAPGEPSDENLIYWNRFVGNGLGIAVSGGARNHIVQNVFDQNVRQGFDSEIVIDQAAVAAVVANNIFIGPSGGVAWSGTDVVVTHNLYFGTTNPMANLGDAAALGDPKFLNRAAGNYRLAADSPARGAGSAEWAICQSTLPTGVSPSVGMYCTE